MRLRTRLAVLTGAVLFGIGGVAASGVATASPAAPAWLSCDGLAPTIIVPAPGMVTFGDPGGVPTNDVIIGTNGVDEIHGLGGDDVICGLDGNDLLTGNNGDDRIFGQGGDDDMLGGNGMDFMDGGPHIEGDRGNGGPNVNVCVRTETTINC
jgi:Ca2+-binding RTX toxin-like protein